MRRVDSLEKTLMLGGLGGRRRREDWGWDGWMASLTWWTRVWVNSGSWWWTGRPGVLRFMGSQRVRYDWATELNWTELISVLYCVHLCMKYSLGISNFLEEISRLSHSIVFFYFKHNLLRRNPEKGCVIASLGEISYCINILSWLKISIKKTKIMASGPITLWQIEG